MKLNLILVLALMALVGCSNMQQEKLSALLATETRAEADRNRDAGRKPAEVLNYLGVKPGMTAMDIIAAGGYYTEVLSLAVDSHGRVYSQNPPNVLKLRNSANDKALTKRLADGRLANVIRLDVPVTDLDLPAESLDVAITALNFHDVIQYQGPKVAADFLQNIKKLLKPGGVLGIIDHQGIAGQDNAKLHRLDVDVAMKIILASGFKVEQSDLLSNPGDKHTLSAFDPGIRGKTDRLLFKLTKQ